MVKFKSFTEMPVWQKTHSLVLDVYKLMASSPKDEVYGLTSQLRRAALSVSGNIVEAFGTFHYLDKNKFYLTARGSLEETKNYLLISRDFGYPKVDDFEAMMDRVEGIGEELNAVVKTLRMREKERGRKD